MTTDPQPNDESPTGDSGVDLEKMTKAELVAYAEANDLDVDRSATKAELLAAIQGEDVDPRIGTHVGDVSAEFIGFPDGKGYRVENGVIAELVDDQSES